MPTGGRTEPETGVHPQKLFFFLPLSTVMVVDFVDNPPPYRSSPYKGVACPANCTLYLVVPSCKQLYIY